MVRRECLVLPRFLNLRNHLDSESMGGQIDQGSSSNEVYRRFQRGNLLLSLGHIRYMTLFSAPWLQISIFIHHDWTGVFFGTASFQDGGFSAFSGAIPLCLLASYS